MTANKSVLRSRIARIIESTDYDKMIPVYRKHLPSVISNGIADDSQMEDHSKCIAVNKNQDLCKGLRVQGSYFCYFHDPEIADVREIYHKQRTDEGRDAARAVSMLPSVLTAPSIESIDDVRTFCIETAHQIRIGELDAKAGSVVAAFVNHIIKTLPEEEVKQETVADKLRDILISEEDIGES
tara:strand:+ start:1257 stop:1805 length:549 start_codon:yes stop_codon:yes gene_type:complete